MDTRANDLNIIVRLLGLTILGPSQPERIGEQFLGPGGEGANDV